MAEKETQEFPETEETAAAEVPEDPSTAETQEEVSPEETKEKHMKGKEQKAYAALQKKYEELNDRYLRMAAEYDNFRKRSTREREHVYADAIANAVKALLPTFDNLERALAVDTADVEFKKGVELTHKQLLEALEKLDVSLIEDSPGSTFDPNLHDAVMHIEDETRGDNEIAETFQRGFMIGDKVIRHSMVKVAN